MSKKTGMNENLILRRGWWSVQKNRIKDCKEIIGRRVISNSDPEEKGIIDSTIEI